MVLDFGNQGVLGLQAPQYAGGLGLGYRDAMRIVEQLGAIDLSLATFAVLHNFLGIGPLQRHAEPALRDELLPVLARGRELAAFALTEPGAGSNPRSLSAYAVPQADGGWRLRGTKVWSGSAAWAGVTHVFAKVVAHDDRPGGMTGFVLRSGTPGLRQGPEALTMGLRGMVQNAVWLDDAPVHASHLLGPVGTGMDVAQEAMTITRLAIGVEALGAMKRALQLMHRYASQREVATGRLLDNPVTLARVSASAAAVTALEALVDTVCRRLDEGRVVPPEAFIACKVGGSERLWETVDGLVQVLGGRGYIESTLVPQLLRDARVFRIFEGPTETLHHFLGVRALYQGAELHRFLIEGLGARVSDRLREAADLVNARWSRGAVSAADRVAGSRWACSLIGEAALDAVLWAAVDSDAQAAPRLEARFEDTVRRALTQAPGGLRADAATAIVSSYAETIGDVEQTLPGEDRDLDPLLRR